MSGMLPALSSALQHWASGEFNLVLPIIEWRARKGLEDVLAALHGKVRRNR